MAIACAVAFTWQATPILCTALVSALAPVLPLIGLAFVSLLLLVLVITIIVSTAWGIGEVCDRRRYHKARQEFRELQLERYRSRLPRASRYRHTDADLRSVRPRVFHRRAD
jgi:hypothetical protein